MPNKTAKSNNKKGGSKPGNYAAALSKNKQKPSAKKPLNNCEETPVDIVNEVKNMKIDDKRRQEPTNDKDSKPGSTEKLNIITPNTNLSNKALPFSRASHPQLTVKERVSTEPLDVRVSKALAAVLRHGKMDVKLDAEYGWAKIEDILTTSYFVNLEVTLEDIIRVTEDPWDSQRRFVIEFIKKPTDKNIQNTWNELKKNEDERRIQKIIAKFPQANDSKLFKMRAKEGHSIMLKSKVRELVPLDFDDTMKIPFAIHGTYWKAWEKIRDLGLKRQPGKAYLDFQSGKIDEVDNFEELVKKFSAGSKNNCEVLVYIDLAKAISNGIPFMKNITNGKVLSPGDNHMNIPPRYFVKAVHISPTTGDQIWTESLGQDDSNDSGVSNEVDFYGQNFGVEIDNRLTPNQQRPTPNYQGYQPTHKFIPTFVPGRSYKVAENPCSFTLPSLRQHASNSCSFASMPGPQVFIPRSRQTSLNVNPTGSNKESVGSMRI